MKYHSTPHAPAALGPYSQAVSDASLLFTSGQVAIDPATGQLVSGGFEAQAEQVMKNLEAVLTEGGSSFQQVLRTTIYVTDLANFAALNTIYGRFMGEHRPARSTVQVSALPVGAEVEIDMVAVRGT